MSHNITAPNTALVVVEPAAHALRRYSGRTCTHNFQVEGEITCEKIENVRTFPDGIAIFDYDLEPERA